ncbi:type III secretion protein [Paludibacterium purpuratum]|uniref:Uncharacterized protein n=1 Tax=Paludibacterium purpuratum TaxID=1144873 RepID=A0A4R7B155_9NEIS|nr:type III secretion protein [Paludibacterium purpuratum]TDR76636.1 hypothetical protein DFP86_11062 [Paludibacterium purpuratum]
MDDVGRYLQTRGLVPQTEYFLGSDFLLGYRVETAHFSLTYRQEGGRLILCDFRASQSDGRALQSLMTWLRQIVAAVPVLDSIDALILAAPEDPALDQKHERLARVMLAEGAVPVEIDGDQWLRYPCRRG